MTWFNVGPALQISNRHWGKVCYMVQPAMSAGECIKCLSDVLNAIPPPPTPHKPCRPPTYSVRLNVNRFLIKSIPTSCRSL